MRKRKGSRRDARVKESTNRDANVLEESVIQHDIRYVVHPRIAEGEKKEQGKGEGSERVGAERRVARKTTFELTRERLDR